MVLCGTKNGSSMASLEEPFEAPLFLRVYSWLLLYLSLFPSLLFLSLSLSLSLSHTCKHTQKHLCWPQVLKLVRKHCANNTWQNRIHFVATVPRFLFLFLSLCLSRIWRFRSGLQRCTAKRSKNNLCMSTLPAHGNFFNRILHWAVNKRRKEKVLMLKHALLVLFLRLRGLFKY